ncbi:uncharacterized protein LOC111902726 [Lactuca sativa]|uniref:uncharacterized protein LOC111902726 n=1 Tax=Lactuca sativa TaxID=4236 RepID=UPI000CD9AAE8|nr:uncharacterized protein LOC111902726 [Lactuca sativa]
MNMKLNPQKCIFGIEQGKYLGHIIIKDGIKANPKKVEVLLKMRSPRVVKEVQALNGKLPALGWFLAKFAEKTYTFYKKLKRLLDKKTFYWMEEADSAFCKLKVAFGELPTLTSPIPGEKFGRQAKWAMELGEHEIIFKPRTNKKAQTFVEFITEIAGQREVSSILELDSKTKDMNGIQENQWRLCSDGSSYIEGARIGLILTSPNGEEMTYALILDFQSFRLEHVSRSKNKCADALRKLASSTFPHPTKKILVEIVHVKAIDEKPVMSIVEETNDWRKPIMEYLKKGKLPADDKETKKLRVKLPSFVVDEGIL